MLQCKDCQHFRRRDDGEISFTCDPFSTIVEPECLAKWQLIKTNQMVAGYQATLEYYQKLAPIQEKMFKFMESEMDSMDESEKWKVDDDQDDTDGTDDTDDTDDWEK